MNEYQVVFTDSEGNQHTKVYQAESLYKIREYAWVAFLEGYEVQVYQLIPVHTDWNDEFKKFVKFAEQRFSGLSKESENV